MGLQSQLWFLSGDTEQNQPKAKAQAQETPRGVSRLPKVPWHPLTVLLWEIFQQEVHCGVWAQGFHMEDGHTDNSVSPW